MYKTVQVYVADVKYDRTAYLNIVDDMVRFDCSDEEYGPVEFPLELLRKKLKEYDSR
jgi:hypothetical protein